MAVSLQAHDISDLCLGKPALKPLSIASTISDALLALNLSEDNYISVWDCSHSSVADDDDDDGCNCECRCVGKLCMVDVICYLCKDENLSSPSVALEAPVSDILPKIPGLVMHLDPSASLLEAIDLILEGAQNLVIPIKTRLNNCTGRRRHKQEPINQNGVRFCWLTQEDIIRFLLSSIGLFSPIPLISIESLDIINTNVLTTHYHSPASSALKSVSQSLTDQTSVAVVDSGSILIGDISPFTLAASAVTCGENSTSAAITTLSSGDLMAYIDCMGPSDDLVRVVKERLKERNLEAMIEELDNLSSCLMFSSSGSSSSLSSSDEEAGSTRWYGRLRRSCSYSARSVRGAEAMVCHPWSSLVAVMIQAIAHRVNYVWVIEDDCTLVGIVTFSDILKVFREHLASMD